MESHNYRVYTVRESQGEKDLFCFGQGKSGKVRESQGSLQWSGAK